MNSSGLLSLESYNYYLPSERIAQFPVTPRDASKLLFISRQNQKFQDSLFRNLPEYLQPGDLLVMNNTKVIPARILSDAGEILLIREVEPSCWDCLVYPGKHFKPGAVFKIAGVSATVLSHSKNGRLIRFNGDVDALLNRYGRVPLPPYIDREPSIEDRKRYQTVYARKPGSIAAPTAGMHFTRRLLGDLKKRKIQSCKITLHVGPGTFRPVKNSNVTEHSIDPEYYSCSAATWQKIQNASRVVSVGTTTIRALETIALTKELHGFSNLFIYPGYQFHVVRGLITNFHLPKSSLLMLVSAFAGYELIRAAYQHAVKNDYRFYSYGDASLIL
ncbi:tRNA preQ1(34) S-adenosylmethionine ribosyltransferase-isomerase QueA [bacterium]|nr:tRNA preQ1(34) S-adenosylmethionine ribosyltransferase-isomerase QueA [bacterium]MCI0604535.1 tRNA preQ1(34) S-adenosylmethionine ribosyltransferase-isomerase QueA [bacterium]